MWDVGGDIAGHLAAVSDVGCSPPTCDACTVHKVSTFNQMIQQENPTQGVDSNKASRLWYKTEPGTLPQDLHILSTLVDRGIKWQNCRSRSPLP